MTDDLYELIFTAAEALEVPVVVLSLLALAWVVLETGSLAAEMGRRLRRDGDAVETAANSAAGSIDGGRRDVAGRQLQGVARSRQMKAVLGRLAATAGDPAQEPRIAKLLADFDFDRQRRLARSRVLVRWGPALGLMGTLIPLSPALEGLARGDVQTLADNLRLAFSLTVLGLLVGAVAFTVSLVRDRMYGQDHSDLEYVAAVLTRPRDPAVGSSPSRPLEGSHEATA